MLLYYFFARQQGEGLTAFQHLPRGAKLRPGLRFTGRFVQRNPRAAVKHAF